MMANRVVKRLLKGTCLRGLGSYKVRRAVRPVNAPLLITEIRLLFKSL